MQPDDFVIGMQVLMYCVPVIALIVSILTFFRSNRERHEKSATEAASIAAKLDSTAQHLVQIDEHLQKLLQGQLQHTQDIADLDKRVSAINVKVENLEHRVDKIEKA